jgi:signal transduction histidine kinase
MRWTSRLSLRHTLALAMSALAVLILVLTVAVANREVRRAARFAAEERLARVTEQLAALAATSVQQRRTLLEAAGRDPSLGALLRGELDDPAVVDGLLASLRTASDSGLPVEVWDRQGGPVYALAPGPRVAEGPGVAAIPLDTVPANGLFREVGGEVRYHSTTPVVDGDVVLGWIVQERRIGNPRTAVEIQRLIGSQSRVFFANPGESLWVTLAGEPVAAPVVELPTDSTMEVTDPAGSRFLMNAQAIPGTPWSVLVQVPDDVVQAGSRVFLRRMALTGLVLVLATLALAWVFSRRLTDPLRELARASERFASGDHASRVTTPRVGDEVNRLATAFNVMAQQVAASHRALEIRLDEARALADKLERANVEAESARAAAEAANRAKSEFLATMSHEIRTPINAVVGLCELMALDSIDPAERTEYLDRTQRAARQLGRLVDDVLDLSKVESGGIRIETRPELAAEAVGHVVPLFEDEVRRKQLRVAVEVEPGLRYHADPQRVEQILLNLVANAVKFTPDGGGIVITARRQVDAPSPDGVEPGAEWACFHVDDTGIGIRDSDIERIFEPFVQAQSGYTREYGGTGLGLSISRRLARLMDGDVRVEPRPDGGSRFTLLLPAADATADPA